MFEFKSNRIANDTPTDHAKADCSLNDEMEPPIIIHKVRQSRAERQSKMLEDLPPIVSSRKEQHILLYFVNVLFTFALSFQNVLLVFTNNEQVKGYFSIGMLIGTILISFITTSQLCKDKWKIFNIYVLLDNIFLAEVASAFGFVGLLMVIYGGYWYQMIVMISFPIEIIFFVGNFRILMLHVNWSRWRIILYKLVLLADSAAFF